MSKDFKDKNTRAEGSLAEDAKLAGESAVEVVGEAFKAVSMADKELLGGEKALDRLNQGIKGERNDSSSSDRQRALEEEVVPVVDSSEDDAPCTELVLIVHGIGQQLATQYESYSFVYAGNQFRQVLRNQASNPAIASIVRDRRCQVLPVQWRASIDLDSEQSQEDKVHGMDNRFTLADITINKSIPMVREVTNAVSYSGDTKSRSDPRYYSISLCTCRATGKR